MTQKLTIGPSVSFVPTLPIKNLKSILTASVMVVNERDKLANAGDIPNSLENSGKMACVQYKIENVLKPAAKAQHLFCEKPMFQLRYNSQLVTSFFSKKHITVFILYNSLCKSFSCISVMSKVKIGMDNSLSIFKRLYARLLCFLVLHTKIEPIFHGSTF